MNGAHELFFGHLKRQVGDYNTFQPKCEVAQEVVVASGCCIGEA